MLRKLNFTERLRIPKADIRIVLRRDASGALTFDATLNLANLGVPGHARVFVEAYHRMSFLRFDCGTVEALRLPDDRRLTDLDSSSIVFRVKIVDQSESSHRVVAVAENIRVGEQGTAEGMRTPLLPVQFSASMGQQVWRIVFEMDTPVLELNNQIDGVQTLAKDDALFFGLVYPAAVREILTRILLVDRHEPVEDGDEWWSLWLRWAAQYATVGALTDSLGDDEDVASWIDEVAGAFCARYRTSDKLNDRRSER